MGIERFFNSLKGDTNISNIINQLNHKITLNSKYLFIDFNSIIHFVSQRVNNIIDKAYTQSLMEVNGLTTEEFNSTYYFELLLLDSTPLIDNSSEKHVINSFKDYFTSSVLNKIIIKNVSNYLTILLKKFNKNKLEKIFIAIDGVPSKAKMVEQKKRRFMGEFEKNIKMNIIEKHKQLLNKEYEDTKLDQNPAPFNKYRYLTNFVNWSRGNISPATSFMIDLEFYLKSNEFKNEVNKILPLVTRNNFIISGFDEKDEGEKKIMDFINNNDVKGEICIYSPDADIILLSMILKNNNISKRILRIDQQKSDYLHISKTRYDIIDIDKLENKIFEFIGKQQLNKIRVINDIVFIFTFFGDDFLHKIESFDVRNDINLIIDLYSKAVSDGKYILDELNGLVNINYKNFMNLLELFSSKEEELLKRNYLSKKFKNYKMLINSETSNGNKLDHNLTLSIIQKYKVNYEIDLLTDFIKTLLEKFIIVESPKFNNLGFIYPSVPINIFVDFVQRVYDNTDYSKIKNGKEEFNQDIYRNIISFSKLKNLKNNLKEIINYKDLKDNIFESSNLNAQIISKKFNINSLNDDDLVKIIIFYYYIYKKLPLKKFNETKLIKYPTSSTEFEETSLLNDYELEIFKFDKMLDEYQTKLNKKYDNPLGNPKLSLSQSKFKFYNDFFNLEELRSVSDLDDIMKIYVDGLQWLVDYYFNGITYHKWYYIYDKSPLLQDVYNYLSSLEDEDIFDSSRKGLKLCCQFSVTEELTPLEQLLYITPFDNNCSQLKMLEQYDKKIFKKITDIVSELKQNSEFSDIYPDIKKISKNILENTENNDIDCRSAIFLNKCILNVVNGSNMIDESKFRNLIRENLSTEEQIRNFSKTLVGGSNYLYNKLDKIKKLYKKTGNLKFKKEYKRIKNFLIDFT